MIGTIDDVIALRWVGDGERELEIVGNGKTSSVRTRCGFVFRWVKASEGTVVKVELEGSPHNPGRCVYEGCDRMRCSLTGPRTDVVALLRGLGLATVS